MLTFGQGDHAQALPALRAAVDLHRKLGDTRSAAVAAIPLGLLLAADDPASGEALLAGAVADFRALAEAWGLTFALLSLGGALLFRGAAEQAVPLLEESVMLARSAGSEVFLGNALVNLGKAYESQDDRDSADRALREALQHAANIGSHETTARALDALAALAVADGNPDRAAQLLGAAEGIRRSAAAAIFPTDRAPTTRTRAAVADLLGEAESTARIEAEARRPLADLLATPW
jgi:tetratricopeptide (TPR) repeat protein